MALRLLTHDGVADDEGIWYGEIDVDEIVGSQAVLNVRERTIAGVRTKFRGSALRNVCQSSCRLRFLLTGYTISVYLISFRVIGWIAWTAPLSEILVRALPVLVFLTGWVGNFRKQTFAGIRRKFWGHRLCELANNLVNCMD